MGISWKSGVANIVIFIIVDIVIVSYNLKNIQKKKQDWQWW